LAKAGKATVKSTRPDTRAIIDFFNAVLQRTLLGALTLFF